jgi:hypothetical protein
MYNCIIALGQELSDFHKSHLLSDLNGNAFRLAYPVTAALPAAENIMKKKKHRSDCVKQNEDGTFIVYAPFISAWWDLIHSWLGVPHVKIPLTKQAQFAAGVLIRKMEDFFELYSMILREIDSSIIARLFFHNNDISKIPFTMLPYVSNSTENKNRRYDISTLCRVSKEVIVITNEKGLLNIDERIKMPVQQFNLKDVKLKDVKKVLVSKGVRFDAKTMVSIEKEENSEKKDEEQK